MKKIFIILITLSMLTLVQASFDINSTSINEKYAKGDYLKGALNISFDGEPLNTFFKDSLDNKVYLSDILNKTSSYKYNCSSENCESIYGGSSPSTQKTLELNKNEDKIIGFQFEDAIEDFNDIQFSVQSTAGQASSNQLKIDILNDGSYETGNTNIGTQVSTVEYDGCFDDSKTPIEKATLELNEPYCQRIELPEAPSFMLGGWIEETTAGSAEISMSLYTKEGTYIDECSLLKTDIKSVGSLAYCQLDYLVPEKSDYYVCVSRGQGDGVYKLKAYYDGLNGCGFKGTPQRTETNAYKIVAKPISFAAFGAVQITNELPNEDFTYLIKEYIISKYGLSGGNLDCSSTCVVPIKLSSYVDQTVTLSSLAITYDKVGIGGATSNLFYDVSEVSSKITSEKQILYLDDLFKLPSKEGFIDYELSLGEEEVYSGELEIKDFSVGINIKNTASGFPNQFNLTGNLSDIISVTWNFGDEGTATTKTTSTNYIYSNEGNYTLSVLLEDSAGTIIEKSFEIIVSNPKHLIENSVIDLKSRLTSFKAQLLKLDSESAKKVEEIINITNIEASLNYVQASVNTATTQEQYDELISIILSMSIPSGVVQSTSVKIPFYVTPEAVDLEAIAENTGDFFEEEEADLYKSGISFWAQENLHIRISTQNVMIRDSDGVYPIDIIFDVTITPRGEAYEDYYLYIPSWEGLEIIGEEVIPLEGYSAVKLSNQEKIIKISASELNIETLPMFISPSLSYVEIESPVTPVEPKKSKLLIIILIFIVLAAIGFLAYLFLQRWYKIKYEKYLFKDRTNLYNVMIYVNNSKKNGLSNEEIKDNLRKSGWNGEQIRYIMRKYEGKNTGMYEFGSKDKPQINPEQSNSPPLKPVGMPSGNLNPKDVNRFNPRYKL